MSRPDPAALEGYAHRFAGLFGKLNQRNGFRRYLEGLLLLATVRGTACGRGVRDLKVGYVLALKPSHTWWHPIGSIGSLEEAVQAVGWQDAEHSGQ